MYLASQIRSIFFGPVSSLPLNSSPSILFIDLFFSNYLFNMLLVFLLFFIIFSFVFVAVRNCHSSDTCLIYSAALFIICSAVAFSCISQASHDRTSADNKEVLEQIRQDMTGGLTYVANEWLKIKKYISTSKESMLLNQNSEKNNEKIEQAKKTVIKLLRKPIKSIKESKNINENIKVDDYYCEKNNEKEYKKCIKEKIERIEEESKKDINAYKEIEENTEQMNKDREVFVEKYSKFDKMAKRVSHEMARMDVAPEYYIDEVKRVEKDVCLLSGVGKLAKITERRITLLHNITRLLDPTERTNDKADCWEQTYIMNGIQIYLGIQIIVGFVFIFVILCSAQYDILIFRIIMLIFIAISIFITLYLMLLAHIKSRECLVGCSSQNYGTCLRTDAGLRLPDTSPMLKSPYAYLIEPIKKLKEETKEIKNILHKFIENRETVDALVRLKGIQIFLRRILIVQGELDEKINKKINTAEFFTGVNILNRIADRINDGLNYLTRPKLLYIYIRESVMLLFLERELKRLEKNRETRHSAAINPEGEPEINEKQSLVGESQSCRLSRLSDKAAIVLIAGSVISGIFFII